MEKVQNGEEILAEFEEKLAQIDEENEKVTRELLNVFLCDDGGKRLKAQMKRLRQRREWDKNNLITVSTRLPIVEGIRFKRLCKRLGKTRYQMLADYIKETLKRYGA